MPVGADEFARVIFHSEIHIFLAIARNPDRSPVPAGPGLGNANPARTVLVLLSVTVPVKLHDDPAVRVDPDFFVLFAHYQGRLRPLDKRLRSNPWRTVWNRLWNEVELDRAVLVHRVVIRKVRSTFRGGMPYFRN